MNPVGENPAAHGATSRPDWYPDPYRRFEFRFHNGAAWTADVSTNGIRYVDPVANGSPSPGPSPAPTVKRDGIATAATVLGIIGLSISWVPVLFVVGAVCAILGVIFGAIALRRRNSANRGFALAGSITGGAGLLMVGVGVWTTSILVDAVDDFENPPPATVEIASCRAVDANLVVDGTISNVGDEASDYRIIVRVDGAGLRRDQRLVIEVDDVEPGATREFASTHRGFGMLSSDDPSCLVRDITGPLPFGLDIDSGD